MLAHDRDWVQTSRPELTPLVHGPQQRPRWPQSKTRDPGANTSSLLAAFCFKASPPEVTSWALNSAPAGRVTSGSPSPLSSSGSLSMR